MSEVNEFNCNDDKMFGHTTSVAVIRTIPANEASVFQEWLQTISWKQQTVIITGLRGCDGLSKYDPSKHISRSIRMAALKNADTTTTYMKHDLFDELLESAKKFIADLDKYPLHFVLHMAHACEIIGYKHPDDKTRETFNAVYNQIVWAMHLRPESKESMDHRLSDKKE